MARDRDVAAFGDRAPGYDEGWRGQLHHQIAERTADLALTSAPAPGGGLVLADLFSVLLLPTLLAGRRDRARTKRRATRLLRDAGVALPPVAPPLRRDHPGGGGGQPIILTAFTGTG